MSRAPALLVLALAAGCGGRVPVSAPSPAIDPVATVAIDPVATPDYYTVHFDPLQPAKRDQFIAARKAWLEALAAAGTTDSRGAFFDIDGRGFMTLRSLGSFAELDQRGDLNERLLAKVPPEAAKAYDAGCDDALAPPHHSEIWRHVAELDYHAPAALTERAAGAIRMVVDTLKPTPADGDAYYDGWGQLHAALTAAHYPLSRVSFQSAFGSGAYVSLWLAATPEALAAAPTIEAAVTGVLGAAKADALFAQVHGAVARSETHVVASRPDLSSREAR